MMPAWLSIVLFMLGIVGCLDAIHQRRKRSSAIDRLGHKYGVSRWEGESEGQYLDRIGNRIALQRSTWQR